MLFTTMTKKTLKLFGVDFEGLWPVPSGLIIAAYTKEEAEKIAGETLKVDGIDAISGYIAKEIIVDKPMVIYYASGDY